MKNKKSLIGLAFLSTMSSSYAVDFSNPEVDGLSMQISEIRTKITKIKLENEFQKEMSALLETKKKIKILECEMDPASEDEFCQLHASEDDSQDNNSSSNSFSLINGGSMPEMTNESLMPDNTANEQRDNSDMGDIPMAPNMNAPEEEGVDINALIDQLGSPSEGAAETSSAAASESVGAATARAEIDEVTFGQLGKKFTVLDGLQITRYVKHSSQKAFVHVRAYFSNGAAGADEVRVKTDMNFTEGETFETADYQYRVLSISRTNGKTKVVVLNETTKEEIMGQ